MKKKNITPTIEVRRQWQPLDIAETRTTTDWSRPPLESKGECLARAAQLATGRYTRMDCQVDHVWLMPPFGDRFDCLALDVQAVSECLEPIPVMIHILAGTAPELAQAALREALRWLETYGDRLSQVTPVAPVETGGSHA